MAQVTSVVRQDIDRLLDHLLYQWERLPAIAADLDHWDVIERIDFVEEWPLEEQRLARLEEHQKAKFFDAAQMKRYKELKRIIAQNRPILARLLKDEAA